MALNVTAGPVYSVVAATPEKKRRVEHEAMERLGR
jgi:hypothetical protein